MIHRYTQIPQNQDFYQTNKSNSLCPNLNISKIFCWIFSLTTWISFTFSIYFLNLDYKHENSNTCYILLVISYLIYIIMEFCSSTSKYLRNKKTGQEMSLSKEELLEKIKRYYDGFSFDGKVRVYNPFSILNFFEDQKFNNYWYISGTPSFLVDYFKQHEINDIDRLRHIKVATNFADEQEIEKATPESFLFQAGF